VQIDHLAISAPSLAEGAAAVEAVLGLALAAGGEHATMGTHNRLLSLGRGCYLEVIAVNPDAPAPARPRWFDLDRFDGITRLTNWVARCDDLRREVALSPPGLGRIHDLARGDYAWQMAIPDDGILPFDGCFPALIHWKGPQHPTDLLPDPGCRLRRLIVAHPQAKALAAALQGRIADARLIIEPGREPALRAELDTPHGPRVLT